MVTDEKEYFAFISYKREDEEWAKWLAHELEHYHLPSALNGIELPESLRPIFRDVDELSAGNLPEQIYRALSKSKNLIVVCSPRSAKSEWVNKEIEDFISLKDGQADTVYPFIIEGSPYATDPDRECFPEILKELRGVKERLGGNVNEQGGRNAALIKVIAGMLGLGFDTLYQRYEREKEEERQKMLETIKRIRIGISRFVAEKASTLIDEGDSYLARRILLCVLPTKEQPDWPHTTEVEYALRKACANNSATLRGHTDCINAASLSSDGKRIVSASQDKTINIWNAETGQLLLTLVGHSSCVNSASFSPNGDKIVSASWDKTLIIWDADTGKLLRTLEGHMDVVNSALFCPNGNRIISASWDKTIKIWDVITGKVLFTLEGHTGSVYTASFSPDGKCIVSSSEDKTIKIWDADTGQLLRTLEGHTDCVNSASFSPNGKQIVSASPDKTIKIWDALTGKVLHTLEGHTGHGNSASFSPDGKYIVSASSNIIKSIKPSPSDKIIKIWDAVTGRLLRTLEGHEDIVTSALFSHDGNIIVSASCDKTIKIWDVALRQALQTFEGYVALVSLIHSALKAKLSFLYRQTMPSKYGVLRLGNYYKP